MLKIITKQNFIKQVGLQKVEFCNASSIVLYGINSANPIKNEMNFV